MSKRKRQPQDAGVTLPDTFTTILKSFLQSQPSERKEDDAATLLKQLETSSQPIQVSTRTQKKQTYAKSLSRLIELLSISTF